MKSIERVRERERGGGVMCGVNSKDETDGLEIFFFPSRFSATTMGVRETRKETRETDTDDPMGNRQSG